ncbi:TipC family immunity protein [Streptococcus sp. F0442]
MVEKPKQEGRRTIILGTWFKNGSSRYSLKNLGDMKIEYKKLIEGQ